MNRLLENSLNFENPLINNEVIDILVTTFLQWDTSFKTKVECVN